MARQIGNIRLTGTIDDITFYYHPEDGYLAKKKTSHDREKVLKSPGFARTRKNAAEFEETIFSAQLIRLAFNKLIYSIADGKLSSRMNGIISGIVKSDSIHDLGKRQFIFGDLSPLVGFRFNSKLSLDNVLSGKYTLCCDDTEEKANISIAGFEPGSSLIFPAHASHFKLVCSFAFINFATGKFRSEYSESALIERGANVFPDAQFTLPFLAPPGEILFIGFGVVFYGDLKNMPADTMSKNKRRRLKSSGGARKLVRFTGAVELLRVHVG